MRLPSSGGGPRAKASFALPSAFAQRYGIGMTAIVFLPVVTLITLFLVMKPAQGLLPAFGLLLFIGFAYWMAYRRGLRLKASLEELVGMDVDAGAEFVKSDLRSHVVALSGAVLVMGGLSAYLRGDIRWFFLVAGIGAVLLTGLLARWLIYDRWLNGQVRLWRSLTEGDGHQR